VERAVRTGLGILEAIAELNRGDPDLDLNVRVGINTGEAVVAVGAHPEQGEGLVTGDVANLTAGPAEAAIWDRADVGAIDERAVPRARANHTSTAAHHQRVQVVRP